MQTLTLRRMLSCGIQSNMHFMRKIIVLCAADLLAPMLLDRTLTGGRASTARQAPAPPLARFARLTALLASIGASPDQRAPPGNFWPAES